MACERKMWNLNQKFDEEEEKSEYKFVLMDYGSRSTLDEEDKHNDDGDDDNDSLMHEDHGMQLEEEEEEEEDTLYGSIDVKLSDPDVLDCCLCCESLTAPVYQCEDGHMVCSSCCDRCSNKCYLCFPTGCYNRCKAIEKVMESMKVACSNAEHGCKVTLSYLGKGAHEKRCIYVPCACPISGCDLFASTMELSHHVSHKHVDSVKPFRYDHTTFVLLKCQEEIIVFQEKSYGKLFVLKSNAVPLGTAVDISCISPNSSKVHGYQIVASSHGSSLKLESLTKNICWTTALDIPSASGFILIPRYYFGASGSGTLKVEINIRH